MLDKLCIFDGNVPLRNRYTFLFSLIIGIYTIISLLINRTTTEVDPSDFLDVASRILDGSVPYLDFGYWLPPGSLIFITVPALFSTDPVGYRLAFAVLALVFVILTYHLSLCTVERCKGDDSCTLKIAIPLAIFLLLFAQPLLCKLEAFAIFFVALGIYLYISDRRILAYAVIIFAAAVKVYPAVFILAFLVMDIMNGDRRERIRNTTVQAGIILAVAAAVCIPLLALHVPLDQLFSWIGSQTSRGFHVESTVGVLIQFFGNLGAWDYVIVQAASTFDVQNFITEALAPNWMYLVIVMMVLAFALVLRHAYAEKGNVLSLENLSLYMGILVLTFVLSNKVFSTQYMMWLLPLFLYPMFKDDEGRFVLYFLLVVSMFLSLFHVPGRQLDIVLLLIRNILLFCIEAYLVLILLGFRQRADRLLHALNVMRLYRAFKARQAS